MCSKRSLVLALLVLAGACGKQTPEDKARDVVADTSLSAPDALARAAAVMYPTAKIWTEPKGQDWRLFVIIDVKKTPIVEQVGGQRIIKLPGRSIVDDLTMSQIGYKRGLRELMVAERMHATVDGRDIVVLDPFRQISLGNAMQSRDDWEPADLEKAKPYDALMNQPLP